MSFKNLFIKTKRTFGIKGKLVIKLDSYIEESHSSEVSITSNPVEFGAEINDHATIEPREIKLIVVVTDTPLGVAAFTEIVSNANRTFGSSTGENLTRSQQAYRDMVKLQQLREPIEIQTKLDNYKDMIITNIECLQDKNSSFIALMHVTAKEIITVYTNVIGISKGQTEGTTDEQARGTEDAGKQETKTPSAGENKTVFKSIIDFASGK